MQSSKNKVGQTFLSVTSPAGQTFLSVTKSNPSLAEPDPGVVHVTRRKLPHWTMRGATYFVTFRSREGKLSDDEKTVVLEHVKSGHGRFYHLLAAVVMPDHVHLILSPRETVSLERIVKGVKGVSARLINKHRGKKGSVWQEERFDRIIRDEHELDEKLNYMLNNSQKAGLVDDGWDYAWWYLCE